ncbi:hypothetical protein [Thorsellia anophelis]|uniref:MgsA AAA+ ATPase C terminal n=1 Tax=Thorsellia anophelis DSM 18579 TaxID=1123402 RepID=A0A1H9Y379_9GAMM|nr:hypothetical protein [Thorsellia anophelis]SES63262.1 MgsA AAA+ ATPase C terminal [Thorsellia anophelis DSM 18579]
MPHTTYTDWSELKTRNGFAADEIISNLQKSIRRSMDESACESAYELYISGQMFLEKLWRRLQVIAIEDIGFGNLSATYQIKSLNEMRRSLPYDDPDQPVFFIHAIRILCDSEKDRSSALLKNIIVKSFEMGKTPTIMDIAIDKHTKRGRELGRDAMHFFHEGSKVMPEKRVNNNYRQRYLEILESYDPEHAISTSFKYSPTQF